MPRSSSFEQLEIYYPCISSMEAGKDCLIELNTFRPLCFTKVVQLFLSSLSLYDRIGPKFLDSLKHSQYIFDRHIGLNQMRRCKNKASAGRQYDARSGGGVLRRNVYGD